jgi:hypothetical protein
MAQVFDAGPKTLYLFGVDAAWRWRPRNVRLFAAQRLREMFRD